MEWWDVTKYIIIGFIVIYLIVSIVFYWSQANYIISSHFAGKTCEFGPEVCTVLTMLGFPEPLLTPDSIIPYVIVPFIVLAAVVYLFIPPTFKTQSRVASLIIPVGVALGMTYSGVFAAAVAVTLVFLGNYAFTLFIAIFILSSMSVFVDIYRKAKRGITGAEEEIINAQAAFAKFQDIKRKWNEIAQGLPIEERVKRAYFKEIEEIERLFNKGELVSAAQRVMQLEKKILGRVSK